MKFETIEAEYELEFYSINNYFIDINSIGKSFREFCRQNSSLNVVGSLVNNKLKPIPNNDIVPLFSSVTNKVDYIDLKNEENGNYYRMGITYWPDSCFLENLSCERVRITFSAPAEASTEFILNIFLSICEIFKCYWGQLHRISVAGEDCYYDNTDHTSLVPQLALYNYFCDHYVNFLGGADLFEKAGFVSITAHNDGILSNLFDIDDDITSDAFFQKRSLVQNALDKHNYFSETDWEKLRPGLMKR